MVRHGIHQQHRARRGLAGIPQPDRRHRGHGAADAVAGERNARGVAAEIARMRKDPARRSQAILRRGGELVLRRQRVVHRDNDHPGPPAELAGQAVMRLDAADDEAAAVEEHDDGPARLQIGAVDADGNGPARAGNRAILHMRDIGSRHRLVARGGTGAHDIHRQGVHRRQRGGCVHHGLQGGMQRHGVSAVAATSASLAGLPDAPARPSRKPSYPAAATSSHFRR